MFQNTDIHLGYDDISYTIWNVEHGSEIYYLSQLNEFRFLFQDRKQRLRDFISENRNVFVDHISLLNSNQAVKQRLLSKGFKHRQ